MKRHPMKRAASLALVLVLVLTMLTPAFAQAPVPTENAENVGSSAVDEAVNQSAVSGEEAAPSAPQPAPDETEDVPAAPQPAPDEAEDAPAAPQPAPDEAEDAPAESQPAPDEAEDAPAESQPAPDETEEVPAEPQPVQAVEADAMPEQAEGELITEEVDISPYLVQMGGFPPAKEDGIAYDASYDRQGAIRAIIAGMEQWNTVIELRSYNIPLNDHKLLMIEAINNAPHLFYYTGEYTITYYPNDGYIFQLKPTYNYSYTQNDVAVFNQAVDKAMQCVSSDMTALRKVIAVHDYLATLITYDQTLSRRNTYQALVERSVVCQGYALAFSLLMQRCGIECVLVPSDPMNHIWNAVKLNGNWYHVDVTWDDPTIKGVERSGVVTHDHLLRSDSAFLNELGHEGWDRVCTCNDSTYEDHPFWWDTTSSIITRGSVFYFLDHINMCLIEREWVSGNEKVLFSGTRDDGSSWVEFLSTLSYNNGKLYWNNRDTVFELPLGVGASPEPVYQLGAGEGYIFGSFYWNNQLELSVGTSGDGSNARLKRVTPVSYSVPEWGTPNSWGGKPGYFKYYGPDGHQLTGVNYVAELGRRYIFDSNGILQTGDAEGDILYNRNIYYLNPDRNPQDPSTCYVMMNYIRNRPNNGGLTFYDADGISFYGWMHAEGGGMRFQTRLENIPGVEPYCIFVWHAQKLPAVQHPDHPGDPAYFLPAGWYLFDDNGIRITTDGEYDYKYDVDQRMHHYTVRGGMIVAIDGVAVA